MLDRRYDWHAVYSDGVVVTRWNHDTSENKPEPVLPIEGVEGYFRTLVAFHLIPNEPVLQPVSVHMPLLGEGWRFLYRKRKHVTAGGNGQEEDVLYIVGFEITQIDAAEYTEPYGVFVFLLPDGRIELSTHFNHVTRYERNVDVHPLTAYELTGARRPADSV